MKTLTVVTLCVLLFAGVVLAASIDGKWVSERKIERDGQSMTITQTFDLKSDGNKLTGKFSTAFGNMEPFTGDIRDGKIDGNKFSFSTLVSTPNGEFKFVYEGTVDGDALKGSAAREGGPSRPFEAKRK